MDHEQAFASGEQAASDGASWRSEVGDLERWVAAVGGGSLTVLGVRRGGLSGTLLALLGGGLMVRGISGAGPAVAEPVLRAAEPITRAAPAIGSPSSVEVEKTLTLEAEPDELYRFWRSFSNLPQFMRHLESVTEQDERRSHWVAKAPAGTTVEWDAEIIADQPGESISWRSLEGADVENSGSVEFRPATGGRGTLVRVRLEYKPPAGTAGRVLAKLFGEEPEQQIGDDLRRFKMLVEAGEIATIDGQPHGTRSVIGKLLSPNR